MQICGRWAIPCFFVVLTLGRTVAGADQSVNVAELRWGTQITATSAFSAAHEPANVADGSVERGRSWLSTDRAALPQTLTLTFAEPFRLTRARLRQANWNGSEYRTKEFRLETSADGERFVPATTGTLADDAQAAWEHVLSGEPVRAVRVVVIGSYVAVQTCGLGEVELFATLPEDRRPMYAGVHSGIEWRTFRGIFRLQFQLDPPAPLWYAREAADRTPPCGAYTSGPYDMNIEQQPQGADACVIRWRIRRTDGGPFKIRQYQLECKTSYSGVYRLFHPDSMSQQRYGIDLPFSTRGEARAENQSPVVWMQQTDGQNTLTLGLLDQRPMTAIEASSYAPSNGGEAPGIANSYVRAAFTRTWSAERTTALATDGLYINASGKMTWFDALTDYSRMVDAARDFPQTEPAGDRLLNSMWHSWYAHADQIDEPQIRDDARRAAELGVKTIELDAGWNIPPGVGYSLEVDGDYRFDAKRFPNPRGMIDDMHKAGLSVVLHVAPLVMGKQCRAYAQMKDCVAKINGKETLNLDPRLVKTHEYLLSAWEAMFKDYDIDGLWYDFLEVQMGVDAPPPGMATVEGDVHEAYTLLLQKLAVKARQMKPDMVIILRRGTANQNAKLFCTHVWPMDAPQDYNVNRREVVYLKTLGPGVLTHACCTSWAISESDINVARQMASVVLAGVPAFSVKLAESPAAHNEIIRAWLKFYDAHKRALVYGRMTPLLATPPSAALRIESQEEAFFGLFEAAPGLLPLTRAVPRVTLVNAYSDRIVGRLEGVEGAWRAELFDARWQPAGVQTLQSEGGGLTLNLRGPAACFSVVLTRQ